MSLSSIRGILLEELVLYLLTLVGYRIIKPGEEGTKPGHSGLEVRGRGEWHQIDALAAFDRTPAFMYPLRLMVEAKCYARGTPVQINVTRNAVGVLKDIAENYFTYRSQSGSGDEIQIPRFNYHSAVFSTSGYTSGAQRYAIAHQIFLIQYQRIHLFQPIIDSLLGITALHLGVAIQHSGVANISSNLRREIRRMLENIENVTWTEESLFTEEGFAHVRNGIVTPLLRIRGSYFGMLQGKWPMHLLSPFPLPAITFEERDEVPCRVYGRDSDRWSFSPVNVPEKDPRWFRLEFDIPEEILGLVQAARSDPHALAHVKQQQFSYLDVAGRIGSVYRQVRLRLDEEWLEAYLARVRTGRYRRII